MKNVKKEKFGRSSVIFCYSMCICVFVFCVFFSTVNLTLEDLRKNLNGEHLEQLVFRYNNFLINGLLKEKE